MENADSTGKRSNGRALPRAARVRRSLERLVERSRQAGMNLTPQRLAVYRTLLESHDHPSPEQLYQRILPTMPSLSLATIYKSLDALERLGLVSEMSLPGNARRYDANADHHHHLVCTRCHSVTDLYDRNLDAMVPSGDLRGFRATSVSVQVLGLCRACAPARGKRSPGDQRTRRAARSRAG